MRRQCGIAVVAATAAALVAGTTSYDAAAPREAHIVAPRGHTKTGHPHRGPSTAGTAAQLALEHGLSTRRNSEEGQCSGGSSERQARLAENPTRSRACTGSRTTWPVSVSRSSPAALQPIHHAAAAAVHSSVVASRRSRQRQREAEGTDVGGGRRRRREEFPSADEAASHASTTTCVRTKHAGGGRGGRGAAGEAALFTRGGGTWFAGGGGRDAYDEFPDDFDYESESADDALCWADDDDESRSEEEEEEDVLSVAEGAVEEEGGKGAEEAGKKKNKATRTTSRLPVGFGKGTRVARRAERPTSSSSSQSSSSEESSLEEANRCVKLEQQRFTTSLSPSSVLYSYDTRY